LSECVDFFPVFREKGAEFRESLFICLYDALEYLWCDPARLQGRYLASQITDCVGGTVSGLVWVIPGKSLEDRIEQPGCSHIVDRLGLFESLDLIPISSEDLIPEAMKCVDRDTVGILPYHTRETLTHIACRTLGEGEAEDVRGHIVGLTQDMSDTSRKELSLPASRSRDDEHRTIDRLDRLALPRIERHKDIFEILHREILQKNREKSRKNK
jgi:hypothetical protein